MRAPRRIPWGLVPVSLVLAVVLAATLAPATAFAAGPLVELVTVGPGSDDLELYGHSALCFPSDGAGNEPCYDFGVAGGDRDVDGLVWDTVRGRPRFTPVTVQRSLLVSSFEDEERSVWVQDLPLDGQAASALQASLEADVTARRPYAYHPYYDNCTTRLRDALDRATAGKLREDAGAPAGGQRLRALSEQGFSGRVLELAGLALFLGSRADRVPTAWEAMFLPAGLRDAVATRLGAPPRQLHERREAVVPTSAQAGRVALVLLGALLAGAVAYGARRSARGLRIALGIAGVVLGLLGLAVDAVWVVSQLPELGGNWVALVLVPTDALLGFAPARLVRRYLGVRLGMLALLATLSATGLVAQPLVAVCLLAALPLGAGHLAARRRAATAEPLATPTARGTTATSP
ncbi:MAG TPA: DUF4105 domain-containing protein [Polyangiaceae bacterium]|nr:DUF4105 domain-containing protein [Polyangiaceae bacterium]